MSIQSFSFILILFFLQLKRLPSASGFLASCFPCQRDALLHASHRPWPGAAHSLRAMVGSAEEEWGPVDKRCHQGDGTGGRPPPHVLGCPRPCPVGFRHSQTSVLLCTLCLSGSFQLPSFFLMMEICVFTPAHLLLNDSVAESTPPALETSLQGALTLPD